MDEGLIKYQYWHDYLNAAEIDLKASLRMVDTILDTIRSPENIRSCPALCTDIQVLADRLRSFITSRMIALDDLMVILDRQGVHIRLKEE